MSTLFFARRLVRDAFDPADSSGGRQGGVAVIRRDLRISAVREQQSQELEVARLRGAYERRGAGLVEPLHREDRSAERVFLDPQIRVGALRQQQLDELEVVHVRLRHRIVATFDVAVVGRQVQRIPAALVGEIGIGPALEEQRPELIVPVVGRHEQRRPSVVGGLVHVGAGIEQHLRGVDVAFARRKHQRRQTAAAATDEAGNDDVLILLIRGRGGPCRGTLPALSAPPSPLSRRGRLAGCLHALRAELGGDRGCHLLHSQAKRCGRLCRRRASGRDERRRLCRAIVRGAAPGCLLECELFLVGSAGRDRVTATLCVGFHGLDVDRRRHVIARKTRGAGLRADVSAQLDQRLDGGGMSLFGRPHQRGRGADPLLGIDVRAGRDEHLDRCRDYRCAPRTSPSSRRSARALWRRRRALSSRSIIVALP